MSSNKNNRSNRRKNRSTKVVKDIYKYRMMLLLFVMFIVMILISVAIYKGDKKEIQQATIEQQKEQEEIEAKAEQVRKDAEYLKIGEDEHTIPKDKAEKIIEKFAKQNDISESEYNSDMKELLEKHTEAYDFVINYPLRKDDPKYTAGTAELTEDVSTMPKLYQWDDRWGYKSYGSGVLGFTGCGPTCLSMVASYLLKDKTITPSYVADYSTENGYSIEGNGSSWDLMYTGAINMGLTVTELALVEDTIASKLKEGKPVILVLSEGRFTTSGHYIVLEDYIGEKNEAGLYEGGDFIMHDPNCSYNTERTWKYNDFQGDVENIWVYDALEKPDEEYNFRNNDRLMEHYNKHGKDMGFKSPSEYEDAASDVVNNPDALHKTESEDGDDVYYLEKTNEFVIVSPDGYIRTYFEPDGGKKYYDRQ